MRNKIERKFLSFRVLCMYTILFLVIFRVFDVFMTEQEIKAMLITIGTISLLDLIFLFVHYKRNEWFNSQNKSPYQGAWFFSGAGIVFSLLSWSGSFPALRPSQSVLSALMAYVHGLSTSVLHLLQWTHT